MFYKRTILPKLMKELETPQIVVLTGMRQVGKTTLLRYLFEKIQSTNKTFLDLENPLHRRIFEEENFDNILKNLEGFGISDMEKAYIFLDEIQNLPEVSRAVKYLYDHHQIKFFLTGSSSFYLKGLFPESMSGRKLVFELFPLTFEEFLIFKNKEKKFEKTFFKKAKAKNKVSLELYSPYYREYLEFGGFPAVVLEADRTRKKAILEEIFKSYFEKDVKGLSDFKSLSKLRDLILLLIPRTGSKIEISKISSDLSCSRETVYSYLAFLESSYFISLLPRFSKSIDRQVAGGKKVYFCDVGFLSLLGRASSGQIFENSVFQNLRPSFKLFFFTKKFSEIDFIIKEKIALEAKLTSSLKEIGLLKKKARGLKLRESYLVSLGWNKEKNVILVTDL